MAVEADNVVGDADDVDDDADELEPVGFGAEVEDEEVDVVGEVDAVDEDGATRHWLFWQL